LNKIRDESEDPYPLDDRDGEQPGGDIVKKLNNKIKRNKKNYKINNNNKINYNKCKKKNYQEKKESKIDGSK
jgi:hypothetical protein